jgi:hypothetical protein
VELRFVKFKTKSNLLPIQRLLLCQLRNSDIFVIIPADKNLGPCILEKDTYVRRVFKDHLSDETTYRRLTLADAQKHMGFLKSAILDFIQEFKLKIPKSEQTYLKRSLSVQDPFPKFYVTAKIHKSPWKTRPIISCSGSLAFGLGKWVNLYLQPIARATNAFVSSSFDFKEKITNLPPLPANTRIFTADAVSMYTNIDTAHALAVHRRIIRRYHRANPLTSMDPHCLMKALTCLMHYNILQFGDTYHHQKVGTPMGIPPAPPYATIYFSEHEDYCISQFAEVVYYKRYIDDVWGLWTPQPHNNADEDNTRYQAFQNMMNLFGMIRWEFEQRAKKAIFLDLVTTLTPTGQIETTLYEKPLNLHLFLPPHSTHPKGVIKGLIMGSVLRIFKLTSNPELWSGFVSRFFNQLLARGFKANDIMPLFRAARINAAKHLSSTPCVAPILLTTEEKRVYFHLVYHPNDPPSNTIQALFQEHVYDPTYRPIRQLLPDIKRLANKRNPSRAKMGTNRMIVCYHRPPNLGNLLSPRIIDAVHGRPVSAFIQSEAAVTHTAQHAGEIPALSVPHSNPLSSPLPLSTTNTSLGQRQDF